MKKLIFLILLTAGIFTHKAFCAPDLSFTPEGGGKFIYCNNPEGITASDLASGDNPVYLMNNENLTPDRYIVYLTHFNLVTDTISEDTKVPGKNIYLNGIFTAKEDSEILLSRTAFEIPENILLYENESLIWSEGSFSSLHAHADLMNEQISTINSNMVYSPKKQRIRTIKLKQGESAYLGDYIENYTSVPYPKHVFLGADMEIKSGCVDFNVFASYDEYLNTTPEHGTYVRDKTQKGIAQSLPRVHAKLEYTIDDTLQSGTLLPVTVYNQYVPEGNTVTEWVTNLNPLADMYTKRIVAESDILPLCYRDPKKLSLYGEMVSEDDKSDIYIFDPFHSDTDHFPGESCGYSAKSYIPNYPQSPENDEITYSCNMGNYGVSIIYDITVYNNSSKDRYFDYLATCTSDLIVKVTDSRKKLLAPVISKGQTENQTTDILASVLLPKGKVTVFSIEMLLPVQNFGGPRQSFRISDKHSELTFADSNAIRLTPAAGAVPKESSINRSNPETVATFSGKLNNYHFEKTDYGYAAYYHVSAAKPFYYAAWWKICGKLYLVDDELNILRKYDLGSPPTETSYAGKKLYVKTAKNGIFTIAGTEDAQNISPDSGDILPIESASGTFIRNIYDKTELSFDGSTYNKVHFQSFIPVNIEKDNGLLYSSAGDSRYISYDGIYWFNSETTLTEEHKNAHKIMLCDKILATDRLPLVINDRLLVPMRFIFEELNLDVSWNQEDKTATATGDTTVSFTVGADSAYINGKAYRLDTPCINSNGRVMLPLRFLSEALGYTVDWIEDTRLAVIDKI